MPKIFIGMMRPAMEEAELKLHRRIPPGHPRSSQYYRQCLCGHFFDIGESIIDHWLRGHMDTPVYQDLPQGREWLAIVAFRELKTYLDHPSCPIVVNDKLSELLFTLEREILRLCENRNQ